MPHSPHHADPQGSPTEERPADGHHVADLRTTPESALEHVAASAESWGGEWQREGSRAGRLILPVSAGVRRGWVGFEVSATPSERGGAKLELRQAEEYLHVDRGTIVVLLTSLFGALLVLLGPFVPRVLPLLPIGFILTIAGWLFVAARLRNSGPEEFLEVVTTSAESVEGGSA
ncbi:MAG: hypothetical protein MPN21_08885 [Thermoanaerobaculia bacterium]|nr:hypothetical protein [Thermoanaerobaculia bacterium]